MIGCLLPFLWSLSHRHSQLSHNACDSSASLFVLLCLLFLEPLDAWWRRRRRRCPTTNCEVSSWSAWNRCSSSCGLSGTQRRSRYVTRTQSCGGSCYSLSETRVCYPGCCPQNCNWYWANWGACQGCGWGTRNRVVVITRNPSCGGSACPSSRTQSSSCNTGR